MNIPSPQQKRMDPSAFHLRHGQWALTPQSYNPSPSASKTASVAFPSKDSTNDLPTSDLITPMSGYEMKVPGVLTPQHSGRGKRLTCAEEQALIRITRQSLPDYEVNECQKSFWMEISKMLEYDTGRSYSWQSCRRRMNINIESRLAHRSSVESAAAPVRDDMHPNISEDIDRWLDEVDAKLKKQEEAKLQHLKEMERIQQQKESNERLREEVRQMQKQNRVWKWVRDCPHPTEMDPIRIIWGEDQQDMDWALEQSRLRHARHVELRRQREAPQVRSRSRSPRRETTTNYRQRSQSPSGLQLAGHLDPTRMILDAIKGQFKGDNTPGAEDNQETNEALSYAPIMVDRHSGNVKISIPKTLQPGSKAQNGARDGPMRPTDLNRWTPSMTSTASSGRAMEEYMDKTKTTATKYVAKVMLLVCQATAKEKEGADARKQAYFRHVEGCVHDLLKDIGVSYINMVEKIMRYDPPEHLGCP